MRAKPILPQHTEFLDEHFGVDPRWKEFHRKLRSKKFVDAIKQDTRSNRKLKRFSRMVGLRQQTKQKGLLIAGDSGKSYRIKYHPEAKRFSCSCKDWTYKRSTRNRGRTGDCKHIGRMRDSMRQGLMKTAGGGPLLAAARLGRGFQQEEKHRDTATKEKIKHRAYKKHLKRPSFLSEWLFQKNAAAARGGAAEAFRR